MTKENESELIRLVTVGDRSAMADLYSRHIGYLTAVCSRYIGSGDEIRDILQESFVKIFSHIKDFEYRGPGSLRAWMTRITVNESLKYLKEKGRVNTVSEEHIPDIEDDQEPETDGIPAGTIHEMIRSLPDGYRTVFNLYVFEEKSHKEIASILGITEGTSASQFHRAKNMLARKIKEYRKRTL